MKNGPFSTVMAGVSFTACVLVFAFLVAAKEKFSADHPSIGGVVALMGAFCLPYIILAVIAVTVKLSKLASWFFCVSSIVLIGLGVSWLGSCLLTSSSGDNIGVGLIFIMALQFCTLLIS